MSIDWNDPPPRAKPKRDLSIQFRYLTGHIQYLENREAEALETLRKLRQERAETEARLERVKAKHNGK